MRILTVFMMMVAVSAFGDVWLEGAEDTYVDEREPGDNFGGGLYLCSGFVGEDWDSQRIIYIRFDVEQWMFDEYHYAELHLACIENRLTNPYEVYVVGQQWDEGTVTWQNRPEYYPGPIAETEAPYHPDMEWPPEWVVFDVSGALTYWEYGGNRGVAVVQDGADLGTFISSDFGGGYVPKLHFYDDTGMNPKGVEGASLGRIKAIYANGL